MPNIFVFLQFHYRSCLLIAVYLSTPDSKTVGSFVLLGVRSVNWERRDAAHRDTVCSSITAGTKLHTHTKWHFQGCDAVYWSTFGNILMPNILMPNIIGHSLDIIWEGWDALRFSRKVWREEGWWQSCVQMGGREWAGLIWLSIGTADGLLLG